jgi:prophage DNA circulation protein
MPEVWRSQLYPATFRGIEFHVESREKGGGRRDVVHEFPKRDVPYSEDLGRRARRFTVSAYVIGADYISRRDALIDALEQEGPGLLVLPTQGEQQVNVDHYAVVERRQRGRMAEFEMTFTEAGGLPASSFQTDAAGNVQQASGNAAAVTQKTLDDGLSSPQSQGRGGLGPSLA